MAYVSDRGMVQEVRTGGAVVSAPGVPRADLLAVRVIAEATDDVDSQRAYVLDISGALAADFLRAREQYPALPVCFAGPLRFEGDAGGAVEHVVGVQQLGLSLLPRA
ncbi:hypothetical protein [Zhihengliuella flava]|uniref:Uncharacterized protein n=1 Tax=Zhihengliuella flava TaxID=1285193 RepID=A0A931DD18_9MICC|nr:hypothetical protein [Zhihengliuella flava]MBG6084540.1 hypothetical protein [Zhihengliuella flava]